MTGFQAIIGALVIASLIIVYLIGKKYARKSDDKFPEKRESLNVKSIQSKSYITKKDSDVENAKKEESIENTGEQARNKKFDMSNINKINFIDDEIAFTYENTDGSFIKKHVLAKEVTRNEKHEIFVSGYCHVARSKRTFKLNNFIGSVERVKTGEKFTPEKWLENILA